VIISVGPEQGAFLTIFDQKLWGVRRRRRGGDVHRPTRRCASPAAGRRGRCSAATSARVDGIARRYWSRAESPTASRAHPRPRRDAASPARRAALDLAFVDADKGRATGLREELIPTAAPRRRAAGPTRAVGGSVLAGARPRSDVEHNPRLQRLAGRRSARRPVLIPDRRRPEHGPAVDKPYDSTAAMAAPQMLQRVLRRTACPAGAPARPRHPAARPPSCGGGARPLPRCHPRRVRLARPGALWPAVLRRAGVLRGRAGVAVLAATVRHLRPGR